MSKYSSLCITAGMICVLAAPWPALAEGAKQDRVPDFGPDPNTAWTSDRPTSDDFLPPSGGPGPVLSDKAHPYVPNGQGQPTYRIADLTNPILKPWVVEQMRKANEEVLAGKVPFIARERCWPAGVPGLDIYNRGQPVHFIQTPKEVVIINELYAQIRHIYLNVPHSAHLTPSWYGESVGHYEGDELVVDTIGLNDRTFVDNYRTPHTDADARRRALQDDRRRQDVAGVGHGRRSGRLQHAVVGDAALAARDRTPLIEDVCEPNNDFFFGYGRAPLPHADKADF